MNQRWIWVVRLIGIVVFLVLMYLLMSLHSQLVKMNEEQGSSTLHRENRIRIANQAGSVEDDVAPSPDPQFEIRNPQSHPL